MELDSLIPNQMERGSLHLKSPTSNKMGTLLNSRCMIGYINATNPKFLLKKWDVCCRFKTSVVRVTPTMNMIHKFQIPDTLLVKAPCMISE